MRPKFRYTLNGQMLSVLLTHIKTAGIFSVVWILMAALWTTDTGRYIFAAIGTVSYFFAIYNTAYAAERDDAKSYTEQTPKLYKCIMLTGYLAAANILIIVLYKLVWHFYAADGTLTSIYGIIGNIISMMWFSMYEFFAGMGKGHFALLGYLMIFLLPFAAAACGYAAGYKGFDIYDKIAGFAYEKKKKK